MKNIKKIALSLAFTTCIVTVLGSCGAKENKTDSTQNNSSEQKNDSINITFAQYSGSGENEEYLKK